MPLLNSITTPYAEAFLQVADGRNETDEIVDQARQVLALWQESPELREAMASPILEVGAKKAALQALFTDQVTPSFLNLLKLQEVCNSPVSTVRVFVFLFQRVQIRCEIGTWAKSKHKPKPRLNGWASRWCCCLLHSSHLSVIQQFI